MAAKPAAPNALQGIDAFFAGLPRAQTPQGGIESGFDGSTRAPLAKMGESAAPTEEASPFAGMGPWMEDDPKTLFSTAQNLVLRQELLAQNRLALDTYFTRIKLGCPFVTLEKDEGRSMWKTTMDAGANAIQAVPNLSWDLCNKATEHLMIDFAEPDVQPANDSEQAQAAAQMAQRFLEENGGEAGTNDAQLFYNAIDKSLPCASSYIERWVDPTGGGSVPLQILAHPQAMDPADPMRGPDGMPTTDPILRYVTAPEGGQFTDDPSAAAPQWQPKIRSTIWFREHIRVFPEDATVENAEKVLVMGYCTLGEAKRRWKSVAEFTPEALSSLCDWNPPRFLVLLPPFQQARWKLTSGTDKEKQGSSDERIMFYYRVYVTGCPENPRGADVVMTGAQGGQVLHRELLAATVEVDPQAAMQGTAAGPAPAPGAVPSETEAAPRKKIKEVRNMDIPITQVTPRADPDGRDPSGLSYMWLFSGATEYNAALETSFLEMLALWTHPDSYMPSTSPVQSYQIAESRASGQPIPILRPEDRPFYGNQPEIPAILINALDHNNQAVRSIASMDKAISGQEDKTKESGKALQIAVQQGQVGLSRMQGPVNTARARDARITIQLAMRDFKTPQTVRYVGEDGSYKAEEWTGVDFALVGNVRIKAGTGTLMAPDAKVQYLGNLRTAGLISPDEAAEAARPSFSGRLGLAEDPHRQYIERCVETWLDGPPEGWEGTWAQHKDAIKQYEAMTAPMQQQAQANADQAAAQGIGIPALPPLPPPPPAPWTPFQTRPNDDEPQIAQIWVARLSKVISTVKYTQFSPAWREPLDAKYMGSRKVLAAAAAPTPTGGTPPAGGAPAGSSPAPGAGQ